MNIEKFLGKTSVVEKYASSFRRSIAAGIDIWIVLFLRVIVMQTLGTLWINQAVINFMQEFKDHFGTETIKNTPEHIDFILNNSIFFSALTFYAIVILVGTFYHAGLNASAWQGTIGKRLLKIVMVKNEDSKISFGLGMGHYFLSVLPFAYIFYLVSYQLRSDLTFFQVVTASEANVFFGITFVIWVQIHLFTKRKTTAYDLICRTFLLNAKTTAKWPWSK